jgi:hypothetical protein
MIAVCSPRPRTSLQNNHSKGSQWWARDVYHLLGEAGRTLCGRDCSEWLTIGEIEPDHNCCVRCKERAA